MGVRETLLARLASLNEAHFLEGSVRMVLKSETRNTKLIRQ